MLENFGVVRGTKPAGSRLYRCAQPQPDDAGGGYRTLHDLGVDLLVQLNGTSDFDDAHWTGPYWGRDLGTWDEFRDRTLEAVELIEVSLTMGRRVAVHCTHGRDRTGCVIGAYRILHCGWSFEMMNAERLEYGSAFIQWVWDYEIVEFLQGLKPE